jgi:hypothetical protein
MGTVDRYIYKTDKTVIFIIIASTTEVLTEFTVEKSHVLITFKLAITLVLHISEIPKENSAYLICGTHRQQWSIFLRRKITRTSLNLLSSGICFHVVCSSLIIIMVLLRSYMYTFVLQWSNEGMSHVGDEKCIQNLSKNLKERNYLGGLDIDRSY